MRKVNQSKVKQDRDEWHDVHLPPALLDPPVRKSGAVAPDPLERDREMSEEQINELLNRGRERLGLSPVLDPAMWVVETQGKLDFLKLFSGSAHASAACADAGLVVGPPVDLKTGFDLNTKAGQQKAWDIIVRQRPSVVFMAPVFTPWSQIQNINDRDTVLRKQR